MISDAADARVVRDALVRSSDGLFNVDWVRSRADGLARLARGAPASVAVVLVDLQVVAEGVESREQLTCLQRLACPQGQGFYLSEPLTAAEFTRLCRRKEAETAASASVV